MIPQATFIFFSGMIVGGFLVFLLVPDDALVTQEMALAALEKRCESGKVWEYSTPNPNTDEALLVVECNPGS